MSKLFVYFSYCLSDQSKFYLYHKKDTCLMHSSSGYRYTYIFVAGVYPHCCPQTLEVSGPRVL